MISPELFLYWIWDPCILINLHLPLVLEEGVSQHMFVSLPGSRLVLNPVFVAIHGACICKREALTGYPGIWWSFSWHTVDRLKVANRTYPDPCVFAWHRYHNTFWLSHSQPATKVQVHGHSATLRETQLQDIHFGSCQNQGALFNGNMQSMELGLRATFICRWWFQQ